MVSEWVGNKYASNSSELKFKNEGNSSRTGVAKRGLLWWFHIGTGPQLARCNRQPLIQLKTRRYKRKNLEFQMLAAVYHKGDHGPQIHIRIVIDIQSWTKVSGQPRKNSITVQKEKTRLFIEEKHRVA